MKASEQTIVTIATACPCTPVTVAFMGDPNALLEEVLASDLGSGAAYVEHLCQFCGGFSRGHRRSHKPDCLWLRIKAYLKGIGRIKAETNEEAV